MVTGQYVPKSDVFIAAIKVASAGIALRDFKPVVTKRTLLKLSKLLRELSR